MKTITEHELLETIYLYEDAIKWDIKDFIRDNDITTTDSDGNIILTKKQAKQCIKEMNAYAMWRFKIKIN